MQYQTVKVQAWDAVAPTEFPTNRRLRTHIPDITHPTLYSTNAPITMLGMGCPHPSFHNSYPVATHDIPNPPIVSEEGFAAADACLTPHVHWWWPPPPEATDRCRVRCTAGTVVYSFAALGAAFVREPGAARMAWMAMAHFTPPLSIGGRGERP